MRIETLDQLHAKLAARRRAQPIRSYEHLLDVLDFGAGAWDESKHPRGQPENKGEFVRKGQEQSGGSSDEAPIAKASAPPATAGATTASTQPAGTAPASEPPASNRGPTLKPDDPDLATGDARPRSSSAPTPPAGPEDVERYFADVDATSEAKRANKLLGDIASQLAAGVDLAFWSKVHFTGPDGQYTQERKAVHQKIVQNTLNPEAVAQDGVKPVCAIILGQGGSGKTTGGAPLIQRLGIPMTTINADDVKAQLPEYEGWNAGALHEESTDVAEGDLFNAAAEANHNMLIDLTGKNQQKMEKRVNELQELGYDVHIVHVACPGHVSCARAWERFESNAFGEKRPGKEPGRYVPPRVAYEGWQKPAATYAKLKEHPAVKSWTQVNTNVPYGQPGTVTDQGSRP